MSSLYCLPRLWKTTCFKAFSARFWRPGHNILAGRELFPFFTLGTCFKAIRPEFSKAESRAEKQSLFSHFGISDTWSNPHNFKDDFEKKKKKSTPNLTKLPGIFHHFSSVFIIFPHFPSFFLIFPHFSPVFQFFSVFLWQSGHKFQTLKKAQSLFNTQLD